MIINKKVTYPIQKLQSINQCQGKMIHSLETLSKTTVFQEWPTTITGKPFLFFSFKDTIFKLIFKLACRLVGLTMKSAYMYCSYYRLLKLSSPVFPISLLLVSFFPQIIVPVSTFTSHTSPSLCTYIP